ncbi:MAG: ACT domain-containing protein [Acidimicrobiia bacterium]|nr:ACT domain-containing protein [Acidimicrobiia bacterium]
MPGCLAASRTAMRVTVSAIPVRAAMVSAWRATRAVKAEPLEVADKPGVLHAVTGVFARNKVSIRAAEQDGIGSDARLVFLTHEARTADVHACLDEFQRLDVVSKVGGVIRIIGS